MGDLHACDPEGATVASVEENSPENVNEPPHPKTDINGNKVAAREGACVGGTGTGARLSPIEVARRFLVHSDCETVLREVGGKLVSEKSFQDDYFDTENYDLTVRSFSLRRRNGSWQLKHHVKAQQSDSNQPCEVEQEVDILRLLAGFLDLRPEDPHLAIDDLPPPCKLQRISSFRTWRKSYEVEGVTVELDLTDFGFSTGKIQAVVSDRSKVCDGITRIDDLAHRLGFRPCVDCDLASLVTAVDSGTAHTEQSADP